MLPWHPLKYLGLGMGTHVREAKGSTDVNELFSSAERTRNDETMYHHVLMH